MWRVCSNDFVRICFLDNLESTNYRGFLMTPRYHGTTAKLNLALELAKKVIACQKNGVSKHEIDDMAQMAQYILLEVEHRENMG